MARLSKNCIPFVICWVLSAVSVPPGAVASSVETFVLAGGGQSGPLGPPPGLQGATFIAPAPVLNFFGPHPPSLPTGGLATCNIAGGFRTTTAAADPLSDTISLSTVFHLAPPSSFIGSASASAQYGHVGVQAHGKFTGPVNAFIVRGTKAHGTVRETGLQPNTNADAVKWQFTVDRSLSGTRRFFPTDIDVRYQLDTGPIFTLMRAQVDDSLSQPLISVPPAFGTQFGPGVFGSFTLAPGSVSGSGVVETFTLAIVPGTPFDFTFGLLAATLPSTGALADIFATARLTGMQLFTGGQPVTDFVITADSGTVYGPNGILFLATRVPKPATLLPRNARLLGIGLWRWPGDHRPRRSTPAAPA